MTDRIRRRGTIWLIGALAGLLAWAPMAGLAQAPTKREGSLAELFIREIERARRQVETLYLLRLTETVALSAEQSAQVAAILRKAQETRRTLLEERRQILGDLNVLLTTGAEGERIKAKLARWEQNENRLGRWRQGLFQEVSEVLSVEQQGRYLLFDEQFNVEVRNAVLDLRRGQAQGTGQ